LGEYRGWDVRLLTGKTQSRETSISHKADRSLTVYGNLLIVECDTFIDLAMSINVSPASRLVIAMNFSSCGMTSFSLRHCPAYNVTGQRPIP
jgi:hypothetical protein